MAPSMKTILILLILISTTMHIVFSIDCEMLMHNEEFQHIDWIILEQCLSKINGENLPKNISENIWRLVKNVFYGTENIPSETYKKLGFIITAISKEDLFNISMKQVEVVEAFGAIYAMSEQTPQQQQQSFTAEQMHLIAKKVRNEWLGKNPKTYSQYDLISMGDIVCHLNVSDIAQIHADAFKEAAEWIGKLKNCPQDRLRAFAELATHGDAFGEPKVWSKLDVTIIGNILNGLSANVIATIDKDKLHLNRFYSQKEKTMSAAAHSSNKIHKQQNINKTN